MSDIRACVARRLITLAGEAPARGSALYAPLTIYDKGLIVYAAGRILYAGAYTTAHIPAGVQVEDAGDVTLVPAYVNAHTHIELAHLRGRCRAAAGFSAWLSSLIPLLQESISPKAIAEAVYAIVHSGTAIAADFTRSNAAHIAQSALQTGLDITLCAEWFGMTEAFIGADAAQHIWPPHVRSVLEAVPSTVRLAPAGHALYSTRQDVLQRAKAYCAAQGLPFALHLAESADEVQALTTGSGPLIELYRNTVLPADWRAPGRAPVPLARHWDLLGPGTLAIHGVQCEQSDADILAATGTALCLCPRSNAYIGVGTARVAALVRSHVLLCLGTDGLSSNDDMNVANEALWLVEHDLVPARAALRMLTRNGAAALCHTGAGTLAPGMPAQWAVLPSMLANMLTQD